jgi:hypothetical protein
MRPHPGWVGHQPAAPVPPRRFAGLLFEETTWGAGVKDRRDRAFGYDAGEEASAELTASRERLKARAEVLVDAGAAA